MKVLGLTGSVGMGKSTVAQILRDLDVPVHEADTAVHQLLAPGGAAVLPLRALFPEAVKEQGGVPFIDRQALGAWVFHDAERLRQLERVLHPLVRRESDLFQQHHRTQGCALCALDIPLLFETGGESRVDRIVVVSAPLDIQRQRVLSRPGMTEEKFQAILARQWPDVEKRKRAHYVLENNADLAYLQTQIKHLLSDVRREA